VEIMFLVDTNVFFGKEDIFWKFVDDDIQNVKLLALPMERYREVVNVRKSMKKCQMLRPMPRWRSSQRCHAALMDRKSVG
jgi:hypothetical protein